MVSDRPPASRSASGDWLPEPPDVEEPHGAAGTTSARLDALWTRSVVRPGVPDFCVPLAFCCVARTTYQPGLVFAGSVNVSSILPFAAATVVRTWPERLLRRTETALG